MTEPKISVVIPAYNEEGHLEPHLIALVPILEKLAPDGWEVLLVDDGSTDRTEREIDGLCRRAGVRSLRFEVNRGKGAAVRAGVLASRGEAVAICDADAATPPAELPRFLAELGQGADVVIGDRHSEGSRIGRPQSPLRRWLGLGYRALCGLLTGVPVRDFNCGFKVFRGNLARALFAASNADRWTYDVEILALAFRQGRVVRALPVQWNQGPRTTVRILRDVLRSLRDLASLCMDLRRTARRARP